MIEKSLLIKYMVKKFAIFFIPNMKISLEINNYKKKFNRYYANLDYVQHFPHLTFFTFNALDNFYDENFLYNLNNLFKSLIKKNINIKINQTNVFFDDVLTNKDTIFFKIQKNRELIGAQKKLLNFFKKIIIIDNKINFNQNALNKNYLLHGYPYVGNIWLPHMTICSIENSKNKLMVQKFLDTKINLNTNLDNLSLWQVVSKNKHRKIFETKL